MQKLKKEQQLNIYFVNETLTKIKSSLLITMNEYKNNIILIINDKCLLPDGWLEMFINDHYKYPNEAIAASIQYHFGKNGEIKEFSEGFKGEKFGTFNHVTDMIFNFALVNNDLGGILYPKNFFQNHLFYDKDLYLNLSQNSEEFWQSAFIIMEDKILRQSTKIFDYTKYLINDINYKNYFLNKKYLFEKAKISFLKYFPNFNDSLLKRQNKIIVSITSYPQRFLFLPDLMSFIKNQNYYINRTILFLYKDDIDYYNLSLKDLEIILTDMDLKPHKKYFYPMKLFRDNAIITLDDDIGYSNDTIESLVNAYIENPNIISGRRAHLMTYTNNGELKGYFQWKYEQKLIKEPDFNLILTGCGGIIYPPDIFNIKEEYLPIIKETITCDDLTLKYYANIKGVPIKWIVNDKINGVYRRLPTSSSSPLYKINFINNNICINKLNIIINKTILKNLCASYRDIQTGQSIYLFDINNQIITNSKLYFNINAYSYCPINPKLKFNIFFDHYTAYCFFNESNNNNLNHNIQKINFMVGSCMMEKFDNNLNNYYFPTANSTDNLFIKIYNYRIYLTNIYKSFICKNPNNCILKTISLENINLNVFKISIGHEYYLCNITQKNKNAMNIFPFIQEFNCVLTEYQYNIKRTYISGLPKEKNNKSINNNLIPKQFIISRIVAKNDNIRNKQILIIGKMNEDIKRDSYNFSVNFLYPKFTLECNLKPNSKYVQSIIYCINNLEIYSRFLIENQIIILFNKNEELLLINEETLIRLEFSKNNRNIILNQKYKKIRINYLYFILIYIILFIIVLILKILYNIKNKFSK